MDCRLILSILIYLISHSLKAQSLTNCKLEIEKVLNFQKDAWNKGNIEKYMEGYWNNDSLIFVGKNLTYGYKPTLENYKKSYPTKEKMGTLDFKDVQSNCVSEIHAYTRGRWVIYYNENTKIEGNFTLIWKKIENKWKIIYDHSS